MGILLNEKRNQEFIDSHGISLKKLLASYTGKRWALVGAGPSLNRYIEDLKKKQSTGWHIACCDMATSICLAHSIQPDLIFSAEARPYPFFATVRRPLSSSAIVAGSAHGFQLSQLLGLGIKQFSFFTWQGRPNPNGLPALPAGGNVSNAMLAMLGGIQGASLELYGCDFSFNKRSGYYARGATNSELRHGRHARFDNLETFSHMLAQKSIQDKGHYTTPQFKTCHQWQNDYRALLEKSNHLHSLEVIL